MFIRGYMLIEEYCRFAKLRCNVRTLLGEASHASAKLRCNVRTLLILGSSENGKRKTDDEGGYRHIEEVV